MKEAEEGEWAGSNEGKSEEKRAGREEGDIYFAVNGMAAMEEFSDFHRRCANGILETESKLANKTSFQTLYYPELSLSPNLRSRHGNVKFIVNPGIFKYIIKPYTISSTNVTSGYAGGYLCNLKIKNSIARVV